MKRLQHSLPLLSALQIAAGTVLSAAAFGLIILPQGYTAGGVTGLARLLTAVVPLALPRLVLLLNLLLLLLGLIFVGRSFVLRTVAVSVLFPVLLEWFSSLEFSLTASPLVWVVVAGGMLGVGSGLILRGNGSAGGFDSLAVVLHRKWGIPVALVMNLCDCGVILPQALEQPVLHTVCGLGVIVLSSLCVNLVVTLGTPRRTSAQSGGLRKAAA